MKVYNPTSGTWRAPSEPERDETSDIPTDELQAAIRTFKAVDIDEIRPELLKSLSRRGILWLSRVRRVARREGRAPVDWQTAIVIPISNKGRPERVL